MIFSIVVNAFEGKRQIHFRGVMELAYRPQFLVIPSPIPAVKHEVAEVFADAGGDVSQSASCCGTIFARSREKGIVKLLEMKGWQKGEGHKSVYNYFEAENADQAQAA